MDRHSPLLALDPPRADEVLIVDGTLVPTGTGRKRRIRESDAELAAAVQARLAEQPDPGRRQWR